MIKYHKKQRCSLLKKTYISIEKFSPFKSVNIESPGYISHVKLKGKYFKHTTIKACMRCMLCDFLTLFGNFKGDFIGIVKEKVVISCNVREEIIFL